MKFHYFVAKNAGERLLCSTDFKNYADSAFLVIKLDPEQLPMYVLLPFWKQSQRGVTLQLYHFELLDRDMISTIKCGILDA
tara:strand:- start:4036 stop:4278 length:243 start_codon:yes stop_codon:yes gene_type:complete